MSTIASRFLDEYDPLYPDSDGKPPAENTTRLRECSRRALAKEVKSTGR